VESIVNSTAVLDSIRAVLRDFYDRVFADQMIGFYFVGLDKDRLIQAELEFTVSALGGSMMYTGRSVAGVHRPLRIAGGHFDRRLMILKETLSVHSLPVEVSNKWIAHTLKLRSVITGDGDGECQHKPPTMPPTEQL
jgi:hemoglobin